MRHITSNKCSIWILIVYGLSAATSYPTGRSDFEQKDEKHFPNGTVVGKYAYLDSDGNPIQVKYFADQASYGVELKSIKVVDSSSSPKPTAAVYAKDYYPVNPISPMKISTNDIFNSIQPVSKQKPSDSIEYINNRKEGSRVNLYKADKHNPDFEVYYQNELKGPKKCGKEKVRVYFDKERKIRNAIHNFDADKYCEQF